MLKIFFCQNWLGRVFLLASIFETRQQNGGKLESNFCGFVDAGYLEIYRGRKFFVGLVISVWQFFFLAEFYFWLPALVYWLEEHLAANY